MKTAAQLKAFTTRVAESFNAGQIRAPVHLSGGNEERLIRIFSQMGPNDWVFSTWRSHYHCLLKGVPEERLFADILAGKSITLCYPEYRILSSAIVGGICPIAVGVAMAIERIGSSADTVHCFVGDMTALSGIYIECLRYAKGWNLPIWFHVEDNGKSVCTPTRKVWAGSKSPAARITPETRYSYELPWPHSGAGRRVEF